MRSIVTGDAVTLQPGEDPGVIVEQAVAGTMDVAIAVADEEHVAVLQDERAEPSGRLARLVRLDAGTDVQLTSPPRIRGHLLFSGLPAPDRAERVHGPALGSRLQHGLEDPHARSGRGPLQPNVVP